jgi:hypothetical protein
MFVLTKTRKNKVSEKLVGNFFHPNSGDPFKTTIKLRPFAGMIKKFKIFLLCFIPLLAQ